MKNSSLIRPTDDFDNCYAAVPTDFPRPQQVGTVAGAQPKFLAVEYEEKYYLPGCTPPEVHARWYTCEDLAVQLVEKCRKNQTGKYAHLSETEILDQYCSRLLKTNWGSDAELHWVIRRTAELLCWPVPNSAAANETEER